MASVSGAVADTPASAPSVPETELKRWLALGLLFLAQMIAIGSISYGFALLLKPLAEEFDLPRAQVNMGLMAVMVGMAVSGPLIGRALDRLSGRLVLSVGTLLFAAGWAVIASANTVIVALLAAFFLLAPGGTALGPVAASTLVSRWFEKRRGLAIGISSIATSMGGVAIVPLLALLIAADGWRNAMMLFGLASSALLFLIGWLVLPSGRPSAQTPAAQAATDQSSAEKPVWQQRDFWLIVLAVGTVFGSNGALLSCLVAYATDRGFTLAEGTAIVSTISAVAMLGKLAVGALSDKVDPRWLFIIVIILNGVLLSTLVAMPSYTVLLTISALSGAALGGATPLWAVIVGRRFGLAQMGTVIGLMSSAMMPFTLAGLHLVGAVYDATGSYVPAFNIFLVALAIAGALILPVRGLGRPS